LIFTGGNSKNGPEYFFRKLLKKAQVSLDCLDSHLPRKHQFHWAGRSIVTFSLTAPSGAANRTIGALRAYKEAKERDSKYSTLDFRMEQYGRIFKGHS
jgi:hypothetical protein